MSVVIRSRSISVCALTYGSRAFSVSQNLVPGVTGLGGFAVSFSEDDLGATYEFVFQGREHQPYIIRLGREAQHGDQAKQQIVSDCAKARCGKAAIQGRLWLGNVVLWEFKRAKIARRKRRTRICDGERGIAGACWR